MKLLIILTIIILSLLGCSKNAHPVVSKVDLPRFMGAWYVQGIIPNFKEKNAQNGIETYTLNNDGTIKVNYVFADKGNPEKITELNIKGKVIDTKSNSRWKVQLFKPFWFSYLIIDLAPDYRYCVVGVPNRKYVWIMTRAITISSQDWDSIFVKLKDLGYKTEKIVKMPQIWE